LAVVTAAPRAESAGIPAFASVRAAYEASDGRLLDRQGRLLQEQRLSWEDRRLGWVRLQEVSPALQEALLQVEDRRFFSHGGVDFEAVAGALWQNLARGGRRGASTIPMQTVALLGAEQPGRKGRRGIWRKLGQGRLAWELERSWSKQQILEAYLNLVTFRGEHRGLLAASRALFGKDPHGLDIKESYLLATLIRAPGMSAAAAAARLCGYAAGQPGLGSCAELQELAFRALGRARSPASRAAFAPHLARRLLSPGRRETVSTLDLPLQKAALEILRDQLESLRAQNARDAAVLVADNRTGGVLAYVGGSGALSAAPEVDMAQSRRQAGSTLKPFLYGMAFHRGYLTPDSWLLDEPLELGLERGSYEPDNYDHHFHGPVPAKVALASSLNVPAVRLVSLVGVDAFGDLLERLGFRALEGGEHYGPSLALGSADITLFDLVQGYIALANQGLWKPLRLRASDKVPPPRRLFRKAAALEIAAILAERGFRSLTFGWDSVLATPYAAAVKTGTSKDMRDNWCVGFTRDYTVGVWVGNAAGEPMWQVSGVSGAAPVWRALMDRLNQGRKLEPFPTLVAEPRKLDRGERFGRILYPAPGAVIALDPDIPENAQRIPFEGEGKFTLDGVPLSSRLWRPIKGKHQLRLSDASGALLDALAFEVR
jgi:penicillin-binding protein 1C